MNKHKRILIIDDDDLFREAVVRNLEDFSLKEARTGEQGLTLLKNQRFDLVLLDITLPGLNGIEVLEKIKQHNSHQPVIMLTAIDKIPTVVECIKAGAFDFVTKPLRGEEINIIVNKAINFNDMAVELFNRKALQLASGKQFALVGDSPVVKTLKNEILAFAAIDSPVLINGETGTGKEVVARMIHHQGIRKDRPFVAINCAAIPKDLMESELFGYAKGAFTGATTSSPGKFELAHTGTLVLDEIGDLRLDAQSKLLRVLEGQEFYRVGGNEIVEVDVRVIASTNKNLRELIEAGTFREDLYYRLNVCNIHVPPLRERGEDVVLLANFFLDAFKTKFQRDVSYIEPAALDRLRAHSWPGNIRELKNAIERAVITPGIDAITLPLVEAIINITPKSEKPRITTELGIDQEVAAFEKKIILDAMNRAGGNKSEAARILKLSPHAFYYRLDKHGIS
jgi:DNA-binding NtrC family response regulator